MIVRVNLGRQFGGSFSLHVESHEGRLRDLIQVHLES